MRAFLSVMAMAAALASAPARAEDLIIDHVTLLDGTGAPARADMSVGIDKGRFTFVTPSAAAPHVSGRHMDAKGQFLIPGLIETHAHIRLPSNANPAAEAPLDENDLPIQPTYSAAELEKAHEMGVGVLAGYLYSGVTTLFDAGNYAPYILRLRAEERAGKIAAPHIMATGNLVTYPGSHADAVAVRIADWPADRPKFLAYLREQKPDIVKITYEEHGWGTRPMVSLMPLPLMQQIIVEANRHGVRTVIHTSNEIRSVEALSVGADALAHPVIQAPISEGFAREMGTKKTPFATTLTIGDGYSRLVEHPEYLDQPLYQAALSPQEIETLRKETLPAWKARGWTWWMKLMTPVAAENIRKVHEAGGVVAIGTDQSLGPAVHREMELLQQQGIAPAAILRMATLNGAMLLGRAADLGSIESGKLGDAVLFSADPAKDINNAKAIVAVIKQGVLVDEDKLPLPGGKRGLRRPVR